MLDVAYALCVEGLNPEQRAEFDRLLAAETGAGDGDAADTAARRAYALAHGEHR